MPINIKQFIHHNNNNNEQLFINDIQLGKTVLFCSKQLIYSIQRVFPEFLSLYIIIQSLYFTIQFCLNSVLFSPHNSELFTTIEPFLTIVSFCLTKEIFLAILFFFPLTILSLCLTIQTFFLHFFLIVR